MISRDFSQSLRQRAVNLISGCINSMESILQSHSSLHPKTTSCLAETTANEGMYDNAKERERKIEEKSA